MRNILLCLLLFRLTTVFSQTVLKNPAEEPGLVKWITIEEAEKKYKSFPMPILIDFYTDWCGWCKYMIKTTYSNQEIASYINTNFYPVKFNAETHDTVRFQGEKYVNKNPAPRSANDFTYKMLGSSLSYPTTLFISDSLKYNLKVPGYLAPDKISPLLVFVAENVFKTTEYRRFEKCFNFAFNDSLKKDTASIHWISLTKALELNKKSPKKIIVNINTPWCINCSVMNKSTFKNKVIANYINDKFYAVDFNAQSSDSVNFMGDKFVNGGKEKNYFHDFVIAIMKGQIILPSQVFFNEKNQLIYNMPYFMTPVDFERVIYYFGEDEYLKTKWDDFVKKFTGKTTE